MQKQHRNQKYPNEIIELRKQNNIRNNTFYHRIERGMTPYEAATTPLKHKGGNRKCRKTYAIYQGGVKLCEGTVKHCAKELNMKEQTVRWLTTPAWHKRVKDRQAENRYKIAFMVSDSE